ncbi:hypothetical protein C7C56_024645 [Massilia glaciei]|uniref:Uncharacterized protein n=2 Tax=Massilia glaciei TaxID=1524097 RepID=A0A2U2HDU6_9BURK|nr:hypothetical protein C7C56_024645 [Massilia glaciei]
MDTNGTEELDQAYERLERETPDRVARAIRWLRKPEARPVRWPLGLLLIVGGFFGFLPILGVELIPVGLLLIAQDIPALRKPVGKATLWLEKKWIDLRRWWQNRKRRTGK